MEINGCLVFCFLGDLQQHLQTMFTLLRPEDTIRLVATFSHFCLLKKKMHWLCIKSDCINSPSLCVSGGAVGERLPSMYTVYGGGVHHWKAGHWGECSPWHGLHQPWPVRLSHPITCTPLFSHECSGLGCKLMFHCVCPAAINVQLVWSYLCGVTLWFTWTEMGKRGHTQHFLSFHNSFRSLY